MSSLYGRPTRESSVFASPVLIGALSVLATIVAVTLAYQANNGLPFVPKYTLHVQIRNASELGHGGEVHMGGALVGMLDRIDAGRDASGRPLAVLDLKLNKNVQPLAVDSIFDVRLKGSIGLKYLEITPGTSSRTWRDGATVPMTQTRAEVDLDQVLAMFDPPTRRAVAQNTTEFSNALVGRGSDLNDAIAAFRPLLNDLDPVARNLASQRSSLGGFFRGLETYTAALVPVARAQASLFRGLNTTFTALSTVAIPYLQNWIQQTPPSFNAVITDTPATRAFVSDTAGLFAQLRPGFATLHLSAPVLADAFAVGTRTLPPSVALDRRLLSLAQRLARYGQTDAVSGGLDRLALTARRLRPPLAYLTPAQSTCNYLTLFLRNVASTVAEDVRTGTALRFNVVVVDDLLGGEGNPSRRPYTTPQTVPNTEHGPLHTNPYPYTSAPGGPQECAAGNEHYRPVAQIGNPPGPLPDHTVTTKRSLR